MKDVTGGQILYTPSCDNYVTVMYSTVLYTQLCIPKYSIHNYVYQYIIYCIDIHNVAFS